jgi:hypothetical protein
MVFGIALMFLVMMDRALQLAMVLLNQTFNMKLMQIMLLIWVLFQTLTTSNWESCIQLVQHQSSFVKRGDPLLVLLHSLYAKVSSAQF